MKNKRKILFVAPPLAGHTYQLIVLAHELALRGYTTAFATEEPFRDRIVRRGVEFLPWEPRSVIKDTSLLDRWDRIWETVSREPHILKGERRMWNLAGDLYIPMHKTLKPIFRKFAPDLVVVDSGAFPAMDLADQHNIPFVILAQFLGPHAPIHWRYPRYGTPFSLRMSPVERFRNWMHPLSALWFMGPCVTRLNRARKACSAYSNWRDLYYNNLMMVSTAFGIEQPRPLPPLIQMVGPLLAAQQEPLPDSLQLWLDQGSEQRDVVYISIGTLATLEAWQARALVEGVSRAGVRILLALRKNQHSLLPSLPDAVRLEEFAPQQGVLAHPAVRAFVSHCGMNSVSESLYRGKPLLCLPIFGDQHYNAARVVDLGAGIRLHKTQFDSTQVHHKTEELLNDARFSKSAERMSIILQHTRGRDRAADLVETVLKVGSSHLAIGSDEASRLGSPKNKP